MNRLKTSPGPNRLSYQRQQQTPKEGCNSKCKRKPAVPLGCSPNHQMFASRHLQKQGRVLYLNTLNRLLQFT